VQYPTDIATHKRQEINNININAVSMEAWLI